jgi:dTDP-3-amino-3,4,6-trideoxy-alpha-D-glucose transaminase
MRYKFIDLAAQYRTIQDEIDEAVARVLASGWYVLGREVEAFEAEFAGYVGADYAVGVASGTDALMLALRAVGVGPGDEVVTVSHTSVATVAAIVAAGAQPVFVDIDPVTYTMDASQLNGAWTDKIVIPVHLYGHPADMITITDYGLFMVEDCAQAHGAYCYGEPVGTFGNAAAFSFYPTKNLGAYGDGGMIVSNGPIMNLLARDLRQYGWNNHRISQVHGHNSRLDELQAAVLRVKLRHLDDWNARRRTLAARYTQQLADSGLGLPVEAEGATHAWHLYVVRVPEDRDGLQRRLRARGVETLVHYPVPVHLQPAYASDDYPEGCLPETERAAREVLSLPLYPEMTEAMVDEISAIVMEEL